MLGSRVKICGITSIDAATKAVECGAHALGFVFFEKSPRAISSSNAAALIQQLPPFICTVGLFVNETKELVQATAKDCKLDLLQFHGDEPDHFCAQFDRPFIKAVRVKSRACIEQALIDFPNAKALLLDAYVENQPGGTGQQFDWQLIPKNCDKPLIVAGGLTADNVGDAIKAVQPFAVDVSGGVERLKGVKDLDKIQQFIDAVDAAYQE